MTCVQVFIVALMFLALSCGLEESENSSPVHLTLTVTDSIGDFSGPTAFGSIRSACILNDSRVIVYDQSLTELVLFSADGEFQFRKGISGEGPGEVQSAYYVLPGDNGGVWIQAGSMEKKAILLDDSLDLVREVRVTDNRINLLVSLTCINDTIYIANCLSSSQYSDSVEHSVRWFNERGSGYGTLESMNVKHSFLIYGSKYIFTVNNDLVYLAQTDGESYLIKRFDSRGELRGQIELPDRRLELRPEWLIQKETEYYEEVLTRTGQRAYITEIDVPEYFNMIDYMGVDGEGRLWALRGNYVDPVFDVFDQDGNLEFICGVELPDWQECDRWRFYVGPGGILAYQENPEIYPLVYRMELVESDTSQ